MISLAQRLISMDHKVAFMTYNRTAAQDATRRIREKISEKGAQNIDSRTVHSHAFSALKKGHLECAAEEEIMAGVDNEQLTLSSEFRLQKTIGRGG